MLINLHPLIDPHDPVIGSGIHVDKRFCDPYAIEAAHLERLVYDVHPLKAIRDSDVTGNPFGMPPRTCFLASIL